MAAVRHIGFVVTSSYFIRVIMCYVPNIVLNFHLDWFSTFSYTWSFMFHHSGWKLPIQDQIFRVLGVNMGQISIFHFITQKGTYPCAIPRLLSHCASKSVQGSLLYVVPRKKNKQINKFKKSHTKSYISLLCPEVPRERIITKF